MAPNDWWRWKSGGSPFPAPRVQSVLQYLVEGLGTTPPSPPKASPVEIPAGRFRAATLGPVAVDRGNGLRLRYSYGMSYPDLLALRRGRVGPVTDGVAFPASTAEMEGLVAAARAEDVALVPRGGGTSVVGGLTPESGSHRAVVTVSLERMNRVLSIDRRDRVGRFECGILGPELERHLSQEKLTLGHFPQSFELSTLGGWLAARSSGQASTLYGDASARVRGAVVVTPGGTLRWDRPVEEATGPQLQDLLVGSEGTLGIFTEATLELFPQPAASEYRGVLFPDWDDGLRALQEVVQHGVRPAVARLSDAEETALSVAGRAPGSGFERAIERGFLRAKGTRLEGSCLAILGYEGEAAVVREGVRTMAATVRSHHGVDVGEGVGESWRRDRFLVPSLRDDLMDLGWMVETLETGGAWKTLPAIYTAVRKALHERAAKSKVALHVGTHLSHAVPTGGCLYFTLIAPQPPDQFDEPLAGLKVAATDAIVRSGGTLSHHHGIGTMHRPWLGSQRDAASVTLLRAAKKALDPSSLLNPSKVWPEEGGH